MRIKQITEGDVVPFGKPNRNAERKYGRGGYSSIFSNLLQQAITSPLEVSTNAPEVRAQKRPSEKTIQQLFLEFPEEIRPDPKWYRTVSDFPSGKRRLNVGLRMNREMYQSLSTLDSRLADRIMDTWAKKVVSRLVLGFGYYAESIRYSASIPSLSIHIDVTDKFINDAGVSVVPKLTPISDVVSDIFYEHNIGGIGHMFVDRQTNGYRVKIAGAEAIDEKSLQRLNADLRSFFGDDFIKLKMDKGELSQIGGRPVGQGLTNYRLLLSHNIKGKYRLR